ncbi:MAG TPA: hypothetical protein DCP08_02415 [Chloroflexi bacterium]|nr:hypothetical protein [Chloroflexota bacterium]
MVYHCPICGAELIERKAEAVCTFCGRLTPTEYICLQGHHICEECQLATMPQVVERVCESTKEKDPGHIANLIMKHPAMLMHSAQHHFIVAPVILAALANAGELVLHKGRLRAALRRTADIPFASCGTRGECGACIGLGAAVSILTKASYLKDKERSLALGASAEALFAVAGAGGPRCCKQSVYLTLETGVAFLKRELGLEFPLKIECDFSSRNQECKRERCKYYEPSVETP